MHSPLAHVNSEGLQAPGTQLGSTGASSELSAQSTIESHSQDDEMHSPLPQVNSVAGSHITGGQPISSELSAQSLI